MDILLGVLVVVIIGLLMVVLPVPQTESDPFIPPTKHPEEIDKSNGYVEIRFKRVNPRDNSVDEGIYLLDGFTSIEDVYKKINCGLITIGYNDKCLERYFGVDDE